MSKEVGDSGCTYSVTFCGGRPADDDTGKEGAVRMGRHRKLYSVFSTVFLMCLSCCLLLV